MGARKPVLNLLLISGYLVVAGIVMVYLVSIASSGSFFGRSAGAYSAEVDRAPGLNPNKSSVVNPAGVTIGVVTGVDRTDDGVIVDFKLTTPVNVYGDATAQVLTKSILGEKALMLDPGSESSGPAESGALLEMPAVPLPVEASDSLDPLGAAVEKLGSVDASAMLKDLRQQLVPILGQLDSTVADITRITDAVGSTDGALSRIGSRTTELLAEMAARDADISSIVQSLAVLTAELSEIVNTNLAQLNDILVLTSRLTRTLASRDAELGTALAAVPDMLARMETVLADTTAALEAEPGHVFVARLANLPTVGRMLEILYEGRP